jgi:hypothetical protein
MLYVILIPIFANEYSMRSAELIDAHFDRIKALHAAVSLTAGDIPKSKENYLKSSS